MSTVPQFDFSTRPLVPFAHDYLHGAKEPWHSHNCAQPLHTLSGVVRVEAEQGHWVVPPSRGVWLAAGTRHRLQATGNVAARTLFIDPFARADLPSVYLVVQISTLLCELIINVLTLPDRYSAGSREERIYLPEPKSEGLLSLCRQIQAQPGMPWTTAQAAQKIGVSERTLLPIFVNRLG